VQAVKAMLFCSARGVFLWLNFFIYSFLWLEESSDGVNVPEADERLYVLQKGNVG